MRRRSVPLPLAQLRVVDFTTQIAGPYCTKLFADAGADVVKVEPPGGDPLRSYAATRRLPPGEDGALFRYLNAGKRSIIGTPADTAARDLVATADLVVEDFARPPGALAAALDTHPRLVVASITPFGRSGPLSGRPATDLTLQAESGAMTFKGDPARAPVIAGGRVAEFLGGLFAAPGALAAVMRAHGTGRGGRVDVSIHDAMAIAGSNYMSVMHDLVGRPPLAGPTRSVDTPGIERAADGLVAFNTNAGHMFQMFLLLVERPDLMDDPVHASYAQRLAMGDAWQQIIDGWVSRHTVDEVIERAVALRVPVARVHDGASIVSDEHLAARGVFIEGPDGLVQPRPPYLIDSTEMGTGLPAPRLDQHRHEVQPWPERPPSIPTGDGSGPGSVANLPVAGLKVLDLTSWWVGGLATHTLALLGADVVHVEGVAHPDGMRLTGSSFARTDDWWEWGHMFTAAATNKRAIALDVASPGGLDLLRRLIGWADVLVENFSPRVAESWGLTPDAVFEMNPTIVYQRMPAYGLTGPWRDRPAFAQTIEPMSGMAAITGHPDALPLSKGGIPDPVAGTHGAWALLVGLAEQRRTGRGVFVEAVMVEAALNVTAQPMLEHGAYGRLMTRMGNRAPHAAPQGVYRCDGADQWLAMSVTDDDQWQALATIVAGPELADDERFATASGRHAHHDELDELIGAWTARLDAEETADVLCAAGVPAAACREHREISAHPHYAARTLFETRHHPVLGEVATPGLPYRLDGVDHWITAPAPTFGQHTRELLAEVAGLDDTALDALEAAGVIATRPRGL